MKRTLTQFMAVFLAATLTLGATKKPVSVVTPAPAAGNTCFLTDVDSAVLNTVNGQSLKCNASTLLWELVPGSGATASGAQGCVQIADASGGFSCDANLSVTNSVLYTPAQIVAADASATVGGFGNVVTIGDNHGLTTPMTPSKAGGTGFTDCDNTTSQKFCAFQGGAKVFQLNSTPSSTPYMFVQTDSDGTSGDFITTDVARFTPVASNPTCVAGYYGIYVKNADTAFTKCENGSESTFSAGGGGSAFSAITGSTNTTAAMVVGTGASLGVSGSGTIRANQMDLAAATLTNTLPLANLTDSGTANLCLLSGGAGGDPAYGSCSGSTSTNFSAIVGSVNTSQALQVGNGSVLSATGSGIIRATQFTGSGSTTQAVDLATAEIAGVLPLANLTDSATAGQCLTAGGGGGDPVWAACPAAPLTSDNTWTGVNTFTNTFAPQNGIFATSPAGQQIMSGSTSYTGAHNFTGFDLAYTMNTSGSPVLEKHRIFDSAHGASTLYFDYLAGGAGTTSRYKMDVGGAFTHALAGNTAGWTESGYSLTGTDATGFLSWIGTLNTSGSPTIFKYSLTDTARGASTLYFDWRGGGSASTSLFKMSYDGLLTASRNGLILQGAGTTTEIQSKAGTEMRICSDDSVTVLGDGVKECMVVDPANSTVGFTGGSSVFTDGPFSSAGLISSAGAAITGAITGTTSITGATVVATSSATIGNNSSGAKTLTFDGTIDGVETWNQTADTNADGTVGEFQFDKNVNPQAGIAFAQEKGLEWAATSSNSSGADPTNLTIFATQPVDAHDNDADGTNDTENMLCIGENVKATASGNCGTRKNTSKSAFYQQFDTAAQSGSRYGEWYLKATSPAGTAFEWFDAHSYHENATPVATFTFRTAAARIAQQLNDVSECFGAACGTVGNDSFQISGSGAVSGHWRVGSCSNTASAATITVDNCNFVTITGSTTITTINTCDSVNKGRNLTVLCGSATSQITDGSNMKMAGNFTCTADDAITYLCDGSNWIELSRSAN